MDDFAAWCHDHEPLAVMQGWQLIDNGPRYSIQRIDSPEPSQSWFDSDISAWRHVLESAPHDATCMAALQFLLKHCPDELVFMVGGWHVPAEVRVMLVTAELTMSTVT